jgi:hypothetical protein
LAFSFTVTGVEDLICPGYFKLFTSPQLGREEPKNYLGYE